MEALHTASTFAASHLPLKPKSEIGLSTNKVFA
jgi:hypothetical protein